MGLKSPSDLDVRTKLLSKLDSEHSTITVDKLITEFERIKIIKKDSNLIQSKTPDLSILINIVSDNGNQYKKRKPFQCRRCGTKHLWGECPNKNEICKYCSIKGHKIEVCMKKKAEETKSSNDNSHSNRSSNKSSEKPTNKTPNHSPKTKISSVLVHQINSKAERKYIDIEIDDKPIRLQVDTAADVSIISKGMTKKMNL